MTTKKKTKAQKLREVEALTEAQYRAYCSYPKNIDHELAIMFAKTEGLLFCDLGGRTACTQHIGVSAMGVLMEKPKAKRFTTDRTEWVLMPKSKFGCETCESLKRKGY